MSRTKKLRVTALAGVAALALGAAAFGAQSAPDRVKLDGGQTTVRPSAALTQALQAKGVTVAPAGRATAGEAGSLVFPIVRGRVDRQTLHGRIVHRGALRLTRGARSLRLRRLVIRTTKRGSVLRATVGRGGCGGPDRRGARRRATGARRLGAVPRRSRRGCGRMAVARLSNVQRSDSGGLLVTTADLTLTRGAARRINRRLGAQVVNGGTRLGTARIEAKPRS